MPISIPMPTLPNTMPQLLARTARFVRENGSRIELALRVKHASNPGFAFLAHGHRLFPFYVWLRDAAPAELPKATLPPAAGLGRPSPGPESTPLPAEQPSGNGSGNDSPSTGARRQVSPLNDGLALLCAYHGDGADDEEEERDKEAGGEEETASLLEGPSGKQAADTAPVALAAQGEQPPHSVSGPPGPPPTRSSRDSSNGAAGAAGGTGVGTGAPLLLQPPPPPQVAAIITKLAAFVAQNGSQFEVCGGMWHAAPTGCVRV